MTKVLVTGGAGFIGSNLTDRLITEGYKVVVLDNFNNYYDPKIKIKNLSKASASKNFKLYRDDIVNSIRLNTIFETEKPDIVVHLAARAGVRPSIENPRLYTEVNVMGTANILRLCVEKGVKKFIFGSSSSVYGNSNSIPFSETDLCEHIISPYGSSKRAAEFLVESFWHSYGLKSVILRFFTVYGPRGRLDMAPSIFTRAIINDKEVTRFGDGSSSRDYTYVDDILEGILKAIEKNLTFEIINLGNNMPVRLSDFIKTIEKITQKQARIKQFPNQPGDVEKTWASIEKAKKTLNWRPKTKTKEGLKKYVLWLEKNSKI